MNPVAKAEIIARYAHMGQIDKSGNPYAEHLRAVAAMVSTQDEKIVAWLHDTVEDTPLSLHDLRNLGFSEQIVIAVDLLTESPWHSHDEYLIRIRQAYNHGNSAGKIAMAVKLADIEHNADPTRGMYQTAEQLLKRRARSRRTLGVED